MRRTANAAPELELVCGKNATAVEVDTPAPARIVALDFSLTGTGYALAGECGVLHPPKGMVGMERIDWIRTRVLNFTSGAELIVMEGYSYGSNDAGAREAAELRGTIKHAWWRYNLPWTEIAPTTLKLFAFGNGRAKKPDMLAAAIRKLKYEGANDDNIIDARWLLEMAIAHYSGRELLDYEKRAMKTPKWPAIAGL
ncbi:MAG TPA: hypothetical protein VHZ95_20960 [Polyangiales bacterium]|nr:hypothetical protein [Polyangiales bacterium]